MKVAKVRNSVSRAQSPFYPTPRLQEDRPAQDLERQGMAQ